MGSLFVSAAMAVDYDNVLEEIGQLGPWQRKLFALLWIPSAMSAMAVFMYDFTAFIPEHRCLVPLCDTANSSIGSFLFGWMSDYGGRKSTLMISIVILAFGGSFPFFLKPNPSIYYALVISRFLSGLGHVGTFMMAFSLALEYVGPKYRTLFGILIETPFAMGGLIVGLVSWAGVRDW